MAQGTGVPCQQLPCPVLGSTSLFDEEDVAEEWAARALANYPLGGGSYATGYMDHGLASPQFPEGTLPEGFTRILVGDVVGYTNGKPKQGREWHSDGSKSIQNETAEVHRAASCGEHQVIS